jgi:parvulin-like peptidyl-prolyl isomerase
VLTSAPSFRAFPVLLTGALAFFLSACAPEPKEAETTSGEAAPEEKVEKIEQPADTSKFPEVAARVNGTGIATKDLLERVDAMAAQGSSEVRSLEFYRRVLDDLIGAELLFQQSRDRKLSATANEVNQQLEAMRAGFPDPAQFDQALASRGLTVDGLRSQIQKNMSIQKLIESDIVPKVNVSEEAVRKFYDENNDEMRQPDRLRVRHILKQVAPDASPEVREAARAALEKIREQASSGADFAALAREHSEDPGSAANGGELTIAPGETVPAFEQAAFALAPGGISPVVETQFGFHVIELQEKIAGQLVPFEQVQPRIRQFLQQKGIQEQIEGAVETLKKSAEVEVLI